MPKPPTTTHTEVIAEPSNDRRRRRNISIEEKQRILAEADRCAHGELAALLRREGVYSSQLTDWRRQLQSGGEAALAAKKPGRKPVHDERDKQMEKLEREKAKLEKELRIARKLLELAGKAHEILGVALPSLDDDEKR
jgi:transposase